LNDAVVAHLRCPVCASPLAAADPPQQALRCPRGHSFDIAKQGYVNLTAGRSPHPGDSAEMVADRDDFLKAGHYDFIADALADAARQDQAEAAGPAETPGQVEAADQAAGLVLDAGTGTAHYLARVLQALPDAVGLGLDVSKAALRRAARAHPRTDAALADLWQPLPLADASVSVLLDVFAPRNGPEFRRVLKPRGVLLVVTPAPDHLHELIDTFGLIRVDPAKADRVAESLGAHFTVVATTTHRRTLRLSPAQTRTLIGMTPSARHVPLDDLTTPELTVTAAIDLSVHRPRPRGPLPPTPAAPRGTAR